VIYNRALADYFTVSPDFVVMHDWWLSLTAAVFGKIEAIAEPTVLYRQHGKNEKAAKKVLSPGYVLYVLTNLKTMSDMIEDSYKQAGAFLDCFDGKISSERRELLKTYASIPGLGRIKRLKTVCKYKTFMYGKARKMMQIFFLLTSAKKRDWKYKT